VSSAVAERPPPVVDVSAGAAARPGRGTWRAVRARRRPAVRQTSAATEVLIAVGLAAVWVLLYAFVFSGVQEARSQSVLYDQLREGLAGGTTPYGGVIAPGTPIALIDAPSVGTRGLVVVEGTDSAMLRLGPGHRRDTPLPGQSGISLLYGRSVTYGAPFDNVSGLKSAQTFTVTTGQGVFRYRVDDVRREGDPLPAPLTAGGSRVVLETSEASGWRAGWAPSGVVLVDATLQGQTQPAIGARLPGVATEEKALKGDTRSLNTLVLWLELLLVTVGAAVLARTRWGRRPAWLVGLPAVLAVLWGTTSAAMLLLPNLT